MNYNLGKSRTRGHLFGTTKTSSDGRGACRIMIMEISLNLHRYTIKAISIHLKFFSKSSQVIFNVEILSFLMMYNTMGCQ